MATIQFTESLVARVYPADLDEAYNITLLSSGITAGHALYQDPTTGAYGLTSATASGTARFRCIALETNVASGTISMLKRGILEGYNVAGMAFDDPVFLGNAAGTLDTVAGTINVQVGRIVSVNDMPKTRCIYIAADYAIAGELG